MDDKFTYWYPVIEETQIDFEGTPHTHDVLCEGHIIYSVRLMCGESREVLKNRVKAKKEKISKKREVTPKMCPVCLEAWKNHPDSQYYRFVHRTPVRVTVKEVPVIGAQV
jgi:hypothetical protein